jgi:hypothetical protein
LGEKNDDEKTKRQLHPLKTKSITTNKKMMKLATWIGKYNKRHIFKKD